MLACVIPSSLGGRNSQDPDAVISKMSRGGCEGARGSCTQLTVRGVVRQGCLLRPEPLLLEVKHWGQSQGREFEGVACTGDWGEDSDSLLASMNATSQVVQTEDRCSWREGLGERGQCP